MASSAASVDTIVLLGAFNPLILDPHWLAKHGIISEFDLEQARESGKWVVTRDLAAMEFRAFGLQADHERMQLAMTEEAETPLVLADVVVNIFRLLGHTPVRAIGLNHVSHRELDAERTGAVLDRLAPSAALDDLLPDVRVDSLNWLSARPDDYAGQLRLSVEPSVLVQGLYLSLNDHFQLGEGGSGQTAAELVGEEWQASLRRADELFEKVLQLQ